MLDHLLADWEYGDDFALWRYVPAEASERDAATRLVLRFKSRYADAIDTVAGYARAWVERHAEVLQSRHIMYLVSLPRSAAGQSNVSCELLAAMLADVFPWLTHLPRALERTVSLEPAHLGGPRSRERQMATMRYAGQPLLGQEPVVGLKCHACHAEFTGWEWLQRHLASTRHRSIVGNIPRPGVLLLDDVLTTGSTSSAGRDILRRTAGADAVIGLFVGRTVRREVTMNTHPIPNHRWAVLFDLDGTLVETLALKSLRDAGRWDEVHAGLHRSHLRPGTAEMLKTIGRQAAIGVVTQARRRYAELLLAHHGLDIPVLAAYEDVPRRKPHPDPILHAARALGIAPQQTIYVGDELRDILAAQRAGAFAIAFGDELRGVPGAQAAAGFAGDWRSVLSTVTRIMGR